MRILRSLVILLGLIVGSGCQQIPIDAGIPSERTLSPSITRIPEIPTQGLSTPARIVKTTTKFPERVSPTEAITPVTGEVPVKLLDSIFKDLSERSGVSREKVSVIQAQEIVWNDGSLGCPQPGVMYTQALVNGFRVILEVENKQYDYHAAESGYYVLCEGGLPSISPIGTPDY